MLVNDIQHYHYHDHHAMVNMTLHDYHNTCTVRGEDVTMYYHDITTTQPPYCLVSITTIMTFHLTCITTTITSVLSPPWHQHCHDDNTDTSFSYRICDGGNPTMVRGVMVPWQASLRKITNIVFTSNRIAIQKNRFRIAIQKIKNI